MTDFLSAPLSLQTLTCILGILAFESLLILESVLFYFQKRSPIIGVALVIVLHFLSLSAIITLRSKYETYGLALLQSPYLRFFNRIPPIFYMIYCLLICVLSILGAIWIYHQYITHISRASIPEAINNLDDGLCIYQNNGRPILMNRIISELSYIITGNSMVNATLLLQAVDAQKMNDSFSLSNFGSDRILLLPNGQVWEFRNESLQDQGAPYQRLIAHNITQLYHETLLLHEKQEELHDVQNRLAETLDMVEQTERERESLKLKLRIHEGFGQTILIGQQYLTETDLTEANLTESKLSETNSAEANLTENKPVETNPAEQHLSESEAHLQMVISEWMQTIADFKNAFAEHDTSDLWEEIRQTAANLQCRIVITDENGYNVDNLAGASDAVLEGVREALYNAVRYADADCLYVTCGRSPSGHRCYELRDNGNVTPGTIHEGGGLRSIRLALERIGGSMRIICDQGVRLLIEDGR